MTNIIENPVQAGADDSSALIRHPLYDIVRCNADEVMVRFGSRSRTAHTLIDDKRRGILADLLVRLSRTTTPEELAAEFNADDVAEIVDQLLEAGVVIPESMSAASVLHLGLEMPESVLAAAEVAIVGDGVIAQAVTENLVDLGIRNLVAADEVAHLDHPMITNDGLSLEEVFIDADLVVVATDALDLALNYRVNAIALEHNTPWIMVHCDGPELIAGPLFHPGQTACFNDYDIQEESARTFRMDYLAYKSALVRDGFEPRQLPRMTAEHAAALVSQAVAEHLAERSSFLDGTVVRIDVSRLEIIREQVLRLPRCPACLGLNNDYRHPFI